MKKRISENTKITLTIGQLKRLVRESADGTGNKIYDKVFSKLDSIEQQLREVIIDAQDYKYSNGFINKVNKCISAVREAEHEAMCLHEPHDHNKVE